MSTLIAYTTKYGCAKKCAELLSKELNNQTEMVNLKELKEFDLSKYQTIILGGSIYMGRIQKEMTEFCTKNLDQLKEKHLGLFICGMQEGEQVSTELSQNFLPELLNTAVVKECFGSAFIFDRMNFMEKLIVKKIAKVSSNQSKINEANISKFAQKMNEHSS